MSAAQRSSAGQNDGVVLVLPTRRAPDAPPAAPPALPPGGERITPVTLDAIVRRQTPGGHAQTFSQIISRTADRTHLATGDGREWLFERNVWDARRVVGFLIEHTSREIIVHDESDLRTRLGIRGWADVLALGFDLDLLTALEPSGEFRNMGGIRFTRYVAKSRGQEVWWSADQAFPSAFMTADSTASTQFSIKRIRKGAEPDLLRPPALRFPAYRVVDVANWLEEHH